MLIIPAVDIKDGKVVRLYRGEFDKVKIYSEDPVSMAQEWELEGAKMLHIVDLDGALSGQLKNLDMIKEMLDAVSIPLEVGGGIRSFELIEELVSIGIQRVVLGTRACEDEDFVRHVIEHFAEKIVISIDAKDGLVATSGWTKVSKIKAVDFVKRLESLGLNSLIFTDISRDGTLAGPNIEAVRNVLCVKKNMSVISSGGVSSIEDILQLKKLEQEGLSGVIVGKALYEKKINLKEAIKKC